MKNSFIWTNDQYEPTVIIASVILGFIIYMILTTSKKLEKIFLAKYNSNVLWVIFQRLTGVFFFGALPIFISIVLFKKTLAQFGVSASNLSVSLLWILGLIAILVPMSYMASKKSDNLAMYPQIRKKEWSTGLLIISAFTWVIYLVAYEYMFRGFLLLGLVPHFGLWTAFALNIAFYSLTHIPKGMKETIGAMPFGAIICLLTLKTGTLWIALCAHIILALSNEWFSLLHQPEMKLIKKK